MSANRGVAKGDTFRAGTFTVHNAAPNSGDSQLADGGLVMQCTACSCGMHLRQCYPSRSNMLNFTSRAPQRYAARRQDAMADDAMSCILTQLCAASQIQLLQSCCSCCHYNIQYNIFEIQIP